MCHSGQRWKGACPLAKEKPERDLNEVMIFESRTRHPDVCVSVYESVSVCVLVLCPILSRTETVYMDNMFMAYQIRLPTDDNIDTLENFSKCI